jgi:hypothetical protein
MNTPAHILIGWAAFARRGDRGLALAAIAGALMPDASLYVLAGTSIFLLGIPAGVVFDDLYFSPQWQAVFAVDNSFIVWGLLLAVAAYFKSRPAMVLCGAALLHLALDLPLHHDDGRAHFWPLSDWIFESPLSYWDHRHHAGIVAPIEVLGSAACAYLIASLDWRKRRNVLAAGLLIVELWALLPGFFFIL